MSQFVNITCTTILGYPEYIYETYNIIKIYSKKIKSQYNIDIPIYNQSSNLTTLFRDAIEILKLLKESPIENICNLFLCFCKNLLEEFITLWDHTNHFINKCSSFNDEVRFYINDDCTCDYYIYGLEYTKDLNRLINLYSQIFVSKQRILNSKLSQISDIIYQTKYKNSQKNKSNEINPLHIIR